jgi:hypothetical protein
MSEAVSRLTIDVMPGDCLVLGDNIRVEFKAKTGRLARMVVVAPRSARIKRESSTESAGNSQKNTGSTWQACKSS